MTDEERAFARAAVAMLRGTEQTRWVRKLVLVAAEQILGRPFRPGGPPAAGAPATDPGQLEVDVVPPPDERLDALRMLADPDPNTFKNWIRKQVAEEFRRQRKQ